MKIKLFAFLLILAFPLLAFGEAKLKITGTYSDLKYNEEGGDLLGCEIRIVVAKEGYEGTFQMSEGGPDSLLLINPITVEGDKIKFKVPEESLYAGEFAGKINKAGLKGVFNF
jgi:hypothetical protein